MSFRYSKDFSSIYSKFQNPHHFSKSELQIDIASLKTALERSDDPLDRSYIFFLLGLLWGELTSLEKVGDSTWHWSQPEIETQTSYYWAALFELNKLRRLPDALKPQKAHIYANIGNMLSNIGRSVESLFYYNRALNLSPEDPQIIGNIGVSLMHYALQLYDPGHKKIFYGVAYQKLNLAINSELHPVAKTFFTSSIEQLSNVFKDLNEANQSVRRLEDEFSLGDHREEISYRKWCLKNGLFLNPLNDLGAFSISARDILHLPTFQISLEEKMQGKDTLFFELVNTIKQDYVTARYLFFEGIQSGEPHFSDCNNLLIDTLEYPSVGLNVNKVKLAFKSIYSIFDKVAYFLCLYYEIPLKDEKGFSVEYLINIKSIWYEKFRKKEVIRHSFENRKNLALRGLYWFSKDLAFDTDSQDFSLNPDAKIMAKIRNCLEHRVLFISDESTEDFLESPWPKISRAKFQERTLDILKVTRALIIYMVLIIHKEESQKKASVATFSPIPIDDLFKR